MQVFEETRSSELEMESFFLTSAFQEKPVKFSTRIPSFSFYCKEICGECLLYSMFPLTGMTLWLSALLCVSETL